MPPVMQGLDLKGMKKHPALIPLFFVLSLGSFAAIICTIRASLKNPDVTWSNKRNPEPWNEYSEKSYSKFYDPTKGKVSDASKKHSILDLITG